MTSANANANETIQIVLLIHITNRRHKLSSSFSFLFNLTSTHLGSFVFSQRDTSGLEPTRHAIGKDKMQAKKPTASVDKIIPKIVLTRLRDFVFE